MDRELDRTYRIIRDMLEAELDVLSFRLEQDTHLYTAFRSAEAEYYLDGLRLRLTWDGKDRWAWVVYADQPTGAFPKPGTYRNIDANHGGGSAFGPSLRSEEQAIGRARELIERVHALVARQPHPERAA